MIAAECGVSVMAVSYALRNSDQVSANEKARIQRVAEGLGYRPDPLLTHLMQHLRSQRALRGGGNLALLTSLRAPFVDRLLEGAKARAERLGYALDELNVRAYTTPGRVLTRTLLSRGVSGILLAPTDRPTSYAGLVDWSQFAAVAMTYSIVEPHLHRVVTHHFDNAVRTFSLLADRGCSRIGLVMTADMEFRTNHSYTGAYFRVIGTGACEPLPILYLDEAEPERVRRWFSTHKPQAVVVANAGQVHGMLLPAISRRTAERTRFVCLDYDPSIQVAGVDQLFEIIGSSAVDVLVGQIHRSERGVPENPTIAMVEGRWVDLPAAVPSSFCTAERARVAAGSRRNTS